MTPSAAQLRILFWISQGLLGVILVSLIVDYEFPPPFQRYIPIGLTVIACAINVYLIVVHSRTRRQKLDGSGVELK